MKIDCSIVTLKGVRMVIALPHPSFVRRGVGDALMRRLQPFYPAMLILLAAEEHGKLLTYAQFDTAPFITLIDIDQLDLEEIDLDKPAYDDCELPF